MTKRLFLSVLSKYLIALLAFALILAFAMRSQLIVGSGMSQLPRNFFWAWERPDDLRGLPPDIGVAYLAATLRVIGDRVVTIPRMQPLMVPKGTVLISVFRIEVNEKRRTQLTPECSHKLCQRILKFANLAAAQAVQIDFDARQDERAFYAQLLNELRAALPPGLPISITALASWCMCDNWMQSLPIDESVPMFFSMGPDTNNVLYDTRTGRRFGDRRCDRALGLSLDEPRVNAVALPAAGKLSLEAPVRLYIFSSKKWTNELVDQALELVRER